MKKYLLIILLSLAGVVNSSAQKTALELNDMLANITDSLYAMGGEWGNAYMLADSTGDYRKLAPLRKKMDNFVTIKIAAIKKMDDIGNSEPLRNAFINFLTFEKRMITEAFMLFETHTAATTYETKKADLEKLTKLSESETSLLASLQEAQRKYGKENGFNIEETE